MRDVVIIPGHTPVSPGAVSVGGVSEYDFNTTIAQHVICLLSGVNAEIVLRDLPNRYDLLPAKVNRTGARLAVELHFNGAASPAAHGAEMLYWHTSKEGKRFAEVLLKEVVPALGVARRGVKPIRSASERGGLLLQKTAMPCVIAEPFFGSSASDWQAAIGRRELLVAAYARAIKSMLEEM